MIGARPAHPWRSKPGPATPAGPRAPSGLGRAAWALIVSALLAPCGRGAEATSGEKPFTLFMGADIAVQLDGKACPVCSVSGSSWIVERNGKQEQIPTKTGLLNLRITPVLKLTESVAALADVHSDAGYTEAADPVTRLTRAMNEAAAVDIGHTTAQNQAQAAYDHQQQILQSISASQIQHPVQLPGGPSGPPSPTNMVPQNAAAQLASASAAPDNDPEMMDHGATGMDAVKVSFVASAPRPIPSPYVVTVARFHERGTKPGTLRSLVYARQLGAIDRNPQAITFTEGGYSPGFELTEFQIHLYSGKDEIATSVSANRVALSRDEAFEYVRLEYVAAHPRGAVAAEAAMGHFPADFRQRLQEGKYHDTYYVKVTSDGVAGRVCLDRDCAHPADDAYLASVVANLRFMPALRDGKATGGVAALHFDRLAVPGAAGSIP
jgi:hypothetical protein